MKGLETMIDIQRMVKDIKKLTEEANTMNKECVIERDVLRSRKWLAPLSLICRYKYKNRVKL